MFLVDVVGVEPLALNALAKYAIEVQFVLGQELKAFHLADHHIVKARGESAGADEKIVDAGLVLALLEDESREAKLDDPEVVGGLLDPLIEFDVVGEHPLNPLQLGDQASELAVEGDEVGKLNVLQYFWKDGLEIGPIHLHY